MAPSVGIVRFLLRLAILGSNFRRVSERKKMGVKCCGWCSLAGLGFNNECTVRGMILVGEACWRIMMRVKWSDGT